MIPKWYDYAHMQRSELEPLNYSAHINLVSEIQVLVHESWSLLLPFLDGMTGSETNVEDLASPFFPLAPSKTWVDEASISKTCSLPHLVPWARWRTSWHLRCQERFCLPGLFSQKRKEITSKSRKMRGNRKKWKKLRIMTANDGTRLNVAKTSAFS